MAKDNQKQFLRSTGLNTSFLGDELEFQDYITLMQNVIRKGRQDLTSDNESQIIAANSPFSLEPALSGTTKNGMLLLHGLFDSPFYVRDLAEYFLAKQYLVRAILLPGHGTVAGDLLHIHYEEWVKAVQYGVNSLAKEVDNIVLTGYSLGGLLALHQVLYGDHAEKIKGLVLLAPAMKPKSKITNFLVEHHPLFSWINSRAKWYQIYDTITFTKYSCFAFNAGKQVCLLIKRIEQALKKRKITIPLFIAISSDDEIISNEAVVSFFLKQPNSKNKLLLYTNHTGNNLDPRILNRTSYFPKLKILNFSHTCIAISPNNSHLGVDSQFIDFQHYHNLKKLAKENLHLGATTKANLKKYTISRLSYNPDFDYLMDTIAKFLDSTILLSPDQQN